MGGFVLLDKGFDGYDNLAIDAAALDLGDLGELGVHIMGKADNVSDSLLSHDSPLLTLR